MYIFFIKDKVLKILCLIPNNKYTQLFLINRKLN